MALKPLKPLDSQCCGLGCRPCVFDTYEEELQIWRKKCNHVRLSHLDFDISNEDYTMCQIERVEVKCAPDIFLFHFKLPSKTKLTFKGGQHVIVRENTDLGSISRAYTIISPPGTVTEFSLLIKVYPHGAMSTIIRKKWTADYQVAVRGPIGTLSYQENCYRSVVLIAAGTGITPLYQLAKSILDNQEDETRVQLLFCCKNYREIALHDDIHSMQSYWNFSVRYFLSDGVDADELKRHNEMICYSHLNEEMLLDEMNGVRNVNGNFCVYLCGSKTFENDMIGYLNKFGIHNSSIVTF